MDKQYFTVVPKLDVQTIATFYKMCAESGLDKDQLAAKAITGMVRTYELLAAIDEERKPETEPLTVEEMRIAMRTLRENNAKE